MSANQLYSFSFQSIFNLYRLYFLCVYS